MVLAASRESHGGRKRREREGMRWPPLQEWRVVRSSAGEGEASSWR
jgi:hypothetical protein